VPVVLKVWTGFFTVLVVPSPNFQSQEVGLLFERSENETKRGTDPFAGVPLKSPTMV
jgi:hypothetical protein